MGQDSWLLSNVMRGSRIQISCFTRNTKIIMDLSSLIWLLLSTTQVKTGYIQVTRVRMGAHSGNVAHFGCANACCRPSSCHWLEEYFECWQCNHHAWKVCFQERHVCFFMKNASTLRSKCGAHLSLWTCHSNFPSSLFSGFLTVAKVYCSSVLNCNFVLNDLSWLPHSCTILSQNRILRSP